MIHKIILFLILLTGASVFADDDIFIISQKGFVKILPIYQSWAVDDSNKFSEFSIPMLAYLPFGNNFGLSLRASQATTNGDYVQDLSGITDTQLACSYYLNWANMVINLGVNIPSGKKELTYKEFNTSYLLSLNHFNFQVPNFGQGFNFSPGLSWAAPLGDNSVFGLGAAYQYKGKFKPFEYMIDDYDPGDEIVLTAGFDQRLNATTTFSIDAIYSIYGTDKIGEDQVFASGNKIVANVQVRKYFGFNELWLFARYRSKDKNSVAIAGKLFEEEEKTTPDQIEVFGQYRLRFNRGFFTTFLAEERFYQETPAYPGVNIFGFGIAPEIAFFSNFKMTTRFKYLLGSYKDGSKIAGMEVGFGLSFNY